MALSRPPLGPTHQGSRKRPISDYKLGSLMLAPCHFRTVSLYPPQPASSQPRQSMTRKSLNRVLRRIYALVFLVVALALGSRFAEFVPGLPPALIDAASRIYDVLRDMSLLIATAGVAYVTNVFQKRSKFVESLEEEWRGIVKTKSALYAFCEKPYPSTDDYLAAFCRISETIDNMRIVYRNAGETGELIGLYPYAPLHDMRRALQSIDPRKRTNIPADERKLARDAILQSFYALREVFLEELDLEEPSHSLLISGAKRLKRSGTENGARRRQDAQRRQLVSRNPAPTEADMLLSRLYALEQAEQSTKPGDGSEREADQTRGRDV